MKVWKVKAVGEEYDYLKQMVDCSVEELQSFDGRSHKDEWIPKKVRRFEPEKNLKLGDAANCSGIIALSQKAIEKLNELIKDDVEYLPLICDEGNFSLLNVTTVLDATDYEKAEYKRFKSSNKILCFYKYAFKQNVINGHAIFRLIDEKVRGPFVTDEFVKIVEENKLENFYFELVWDSEAE